MAKASKNTRGRKTAKPGTHRQADGCETSRARYANKRDAEAADPNGRAEHCGRCKGFHAASDRPRSRRGR